MLWLFNRTTRWIYFISDLYLNRSKVVYKNFISANW
jgi:hypothetical protein